MSEVDKPDQIDRLNKIVQITAIAIAAIWGIYTFLYTQVLVPKSAPINITMGLELKKAAEPPQITKGAVPALLPVEVHVSAKNPSSREVYLLPNFWVAYGIKITPSAITEDPFKQGLVISATTGTGSVQRHAKESAPTIVAYGRLLTDDVLKPNEGADRRMIFYVPPEEYDLIRVYTNVPTADKMGVLDVKYQIDEKNGVQATTFRLGSKGSRTEIKPDADIDLYKRYEFQSAHSEADLSLR